MPMGMLIMHWDERVGINVLGAYPEEVEIQEKTLMQIYSQHEFSGDAGLVSLFAGASNLTSYYTGPETGVYIILILTSDEDGDVYEEGLVETSRQILTNIDSDTLKQLLPSLFQRLSVYPTLNEEQKYAMIYSSEVKRMILDRLREESVVPKSEIGIWLKDQYEEGFVDLDSIINSMVKNGFATITSVQGFSTEMVFLTLDLMVMRVPPINIIKDPTGRHLPESLKKDYMVEVTNFFENYLIAKEDNIQVIEEVILDPAVYETVKLLREAVVTRNDLEKLKKKGVDNVDRVLKALWQNKMIAVLKDMKGTEYYCLTSDFYIGTVYPKYNVNTIRDQYRLRSKNPQALIRALEIMKSQYYTYFESQKNEKKAKSKEEIPEEA